MRQAYLNDLCVAVLAVVLLAATPCYAMESALELREIYAQSVDRRLTVPPEELRFYAERLTRELQQAGLEQLPPQYLVLVDRSPQVQALLLFWMSDDGVAEFIGASPVSTGRKGGFMYYETPLGVFDHAVANLDFRAEGTENERGIMGYGVKGMRVYDFGWQRARRTWKPGEWDMRLQMHATDPRYLEQRLGTVQSMGCIRIPAALNALFDHYGILDADYELAMASGQLFWMLRPDREPTRWSGRYLVIIDSYRATRPDWSPLPGTTTRLPRIKPDTVPR
ncbi:MAG TPA: L,D-transpeptidase [Gallionella sp.]|nr:L,D-transpeptidase [Gallionella sp.]